ncbi:MAG: type I-E CRISPR-associated protein Cas7/Cse4/CasC [Deltaproteobacteria bacterium]|nr:type I-E CRISPR-associated protein Cas7/Cse4/CasC [Deltaproteobacteria bacterium]
MKLEIHVLQNFAPSNLNRDDTGAPKDCELGGYRRARISSQCQKRAVRQSFVLDKLLAKDDLGARTKRLVATVATMLAEQHGRDRAHALAVVMGALEGVGLGKSKKGGEGDDAWKTEYLLFLPQRTLTDLTTLLNSHWDELSALVAPEESDDSADEAVDASGKKAKKAKSDKKKEKSAAKSAYPKEVGVEVNRLLEHARGAVDVALFGRMMADKPEWNVDAACQVAHALSTNRVQMDFDFFTAVDDLKPNDNAGSDMMGTVQFNSSCFYRYAVLDVDALKRNLGADEALMKRAVQSFVQAFVVAIPTGKQNGTAAHNFPSYVLAVVRESGPSLSLANAFLKPARPSIKGGEEMDLVDDSIAKLEGYAARLSDVTGDALRLAWADRDLAGDPSAPTRAKTPSELYQRVTERALGATP